MIADGKESIGVHSAGNKREAVIIKLPIVSYMQKKWSMRECLNQVLSNKTDNQHISKNSLIFSKSLNASVSTDIKQEFASFLKVIFFLFEDRINSFGYHYYNQKTIIL